MPIISAFQIGRGPSIPKEVIPFFQLPFHLPLLFLDLSLSEMEFRKKRLIEKDGAVTGHGAETGFRIPWDLELSNDEQIHGAVEPGRDFERDRNASGRDCQDEHIRRFCVFRRQ
jgi:hypothetical protein